MSYLIKITRKRGTEVSFVESNDCPRIGEIWYHEGAPWRVEHVTHLR